MKMICCRCGKELENSYKKSHNDHIISHGYCEPCAEQFMHEELGKPLHEFLDTLGVPVLVIEPGPKVRTVNSQACALLGKQLTEIQGHKGGEVIECEHARTPGGCGKDIHCKSCTIRNTVLKTFDTGKSFEKVLAYPDIYIDEEVQTASIEISTEKVGAMVLLRIDDMRITNKTRQDQASENSQP